MTESDDRMQALEARLAQLEARGLLLPATAARPMSIDLHPGWPLALGLAALALGYLGLGRELHPYQPLFAALFLLLAYHRGVVRVYPQPWRWPMVILNLLLLVLVFKLLLGGGQVHPFDWLKAPNVQQLPPTDQSWAQRYLPHFEFAWKPIEGVSDWNVDITKIQSMLLIATLIGSLFRFQPFASLTALALLLVSFPSYVVFDWDFLVLFLVLGGAAIYLQSEARR